MFYVFFIGWENIRFVYAYQKICLYLLENAAISADNPGGCLTGLPKYVSRLFMNLLFNK